jgi:hypothetical protein
MSARRWKAIKDAVTFFVGIAGIIHQTLIEHTDRWGLLLLFSSMIGLGTAWATKLREHLPEGSPLTLGGK